jgi:energy-coupling factor transporter ATP-binding protein EcfA2
MNKNQLRLPSGKVITFNDEQFEGLKKIKHWLKNGETFFTLDGPAGSGKSTIIKKILDNYCGGVVVSAPTHKAVSVVQKITGKEGQTLHALLGLRPDLDISDFNPNSPIFNPIALPKINNYNLVIIDECSMINKGLFDLIKKTVKNRTKILFIGDICQIPPVGEKESVVFFQDNIIKHSLIKVERQQDTNPILLIADDVRNNLTKHDGGFLRKTNLNENNEGIEFFTDKKLFRNKVFNMFLSNSFKKDIDYCKGIAWKNETIMKSNKIVREKIFGKDADIIELDDVIMGYRTITNERQTHAIIKNSIDYRVVKKSGLDENAYGITGYNVQLREETLSKEFKYENVFFINTEDHDNLHLYAEMHDFFRDMGLSNKKKWKKYYEFRRNNLLMKSIDKYRNGLYRGSRDIIVKDLDYGYFLTCHKAQGSTYKHVVIILNDLEDNWVLKERNQLFYTSLTRPTTTATILSNKID